MAEKKIGDTREGRSRPPRFIDDRIPRYYQLQNILQGKITAGEFRAGSKIPTEAAMVKDYGISRITVRQALRALENAGLIRREAGRGTFVNEDHPFTESLKFEGSLDELISLGLSDSVEVLSLGTIHALKADAEKLGLREGAKLIRCTRLRIRHRQPYCLVTNDLPFEIGQKIRRADWNGSVSRILEKKLNMPLREAYQTVSASLADSSLARLLSCMIGAPLLSVDRIVYTDNGRPVERVRTLYRSDIFNFTMHLGRTTGLTKRTFKNSRKKLLAMNSSTHKV
jgi:GntR family transcriptional regulator